MKEASDRLQEQTNKDRCLTVADGFGGKKPEDSTQKDMMDLQMMSFQTAIACRDLIDSDFGCTGSGVETFHL